MPESLLSPSWYRVAQLRPRIRAQVTFHRHRYRGRTWWVLLDGSTGRSHRLSEAAYALAGRMDGARTTQQLWEDVCAELGDDAPTQDETIRLLGLLDLANALDADATPNTRAFLHRQQRRERQEWWRRYTNPISIRVPLLDPSALLDRGAPVVAPFITRPFAALLAGTTALAGLLALVHAPALGAAADRFFADPRSWLLLAGSYPLLKVAHELGHAFAARRFGVAVHEMGVLFMALMPMPYVDASGASVLASRRQRMAVGAAGIAVEAFVSSLALFVWLAVGPGWVSTAAFAVLVLGGASTLLFNGNPLLRYDGYYVLADWLEIPNLYGRSREYVAFLVKTRLLGLDRVRDPALESGEAKWLLAYGVAASVYRIVVLSAIALFFAAHFFALGIALALFTLVTQIVVPVLRGLDFLATSPQLGERQGRAVTRAGAAMAVALLAVFVLPLPLSTRTQGVVWPGERAQVRAGAEGFVVRLLAVPGERVEAGHPLALLDAPSLEAEHTIARARLDEIRARLQSERYSDRARAERTASELLVAEAALARAVERSGERVLRAGAPGRFVVSGPRELAGRFVAKGELVAYVLGGDTDTVRVVVPQDDAVLVRDATRSVAVRTASRVGEVHAARVRSEVPAAEHALPAPSLGTTGGGPWLADPADPEGLRVSEPVFQLDLAVEPGALGEAVGERVHVRFDHGSEPLGWRALRALRRLLLRRVDV